MFKLTSYLQRWKALERREEHRTLELLIHEVMGRARQLQEGECKGNTPGESSGNRLPEAEDLSSFGFV